MKKLFLTLSLASVTIQAHAAYLFIDSPTPVLTNKEVLVTVRLNTEGEIINTVEGTLDVGELKNDIQAIYVGNSFPFWPNKPSLSGSVVTFIAGTPTNIKGEDISLFTIALTPSSLDTPIATKNLKVYLADGQGTEIYGHPTEYTLKDIDISKTGSASTVEELLADDRNRPLPFKIELGQDPSLFEGKYFISFETTDNESGVKYYEVREGDNNFVRSGSPYVLQDQTLKSKVYVRAIDNAGNIITERYVHNKYIPLIVITSLILLLGGILIYRKFFHA